MSHGWLQILSTLGITTEALHLPTTATCPLCWAPGTLHIQADVAWESWWSACCHCGHTGDILALASSIWKTERKEALERLQQAGCGKEPGQKERWLEQHQRQLLLQEVWGKAQKKLTEHPMGRFWLSELNVRVEPPPRWLGLISLRELEEAGLIPSARWRRSAPPGKRSDWEHTLAVPLYDLPGRICAFYLRSRLLPPECAMVRYLLGGCTGRGDHHGHEDPGLACLPVLGSATAALAGLVLIMDDPLEAAVLHAQHAQDSLLPLPLLAQPPHNLSQAKRAHWNRAGGWLQDRRPVVWCRELEPAGLRQALWHRAEVCSAADNCDIDVARQLGPVAWLQACNQAARPWYRHLEDLLRWRDEPWLKRLFYGLKPDQEQIDAAMVGMTPDGSRRLQKLLRRPVRSIQHVLARGPVQIFVDEEGHRLIAETSWGGRFALTDFLLEVERCYHIGENAYYAVTLHGPQGREEFVIPGHAIDSGHLSQLFSRHGCASAWHHGYKGRTLFGIFADLSNIEHITLEKLYGWDPPSRRLRLHDFSLSTQGVHADLSLPIAVNSRSAQGLKPPELLLPQERELLDQEGLAGELARDFLAWLGGALLNPAFRGARSGLALVGEGAQALGKEAARWLGCPAHDVAQYDDELLFSLEKENNWPVLFAIEREIVRASAMAWLRDPGGRNCILLADWPCQTICTGSGGWDWLQCVTPVPVPPELAGPLQKALPNYLLWALQHQPAAYRFSTEAGLLFFKQWGRSVGLTRTEQVGQHLQLDPVGQLTGANRIAQRFLLLLCYLHDAGRLAVAQGIRRKATHLEEHEKEDVLFVPRHLVLQALDCTGPLVLNLTDLQLRFSSALCYLGEQQRGVVRGLTFRLSAWRQAQQYWQSQLQPRLRGERPCKQSPPRKPRPGLKKRKSS